MGYNESLNIIKQEIQNLKINCIDTNEIIQKTGNTYFIKSIGTILATNITNKMGQPWLSEKELEKIYNIPIKNKISTRGNKYCQFENNRIHSSIINEGMELNNNYLDIYLHFSYIGNIDDIIKYYNPFFKIRINIYPYLIYIKLIHNIDINSENIYLKESNIDKSIDRVIINESDI